MAVKQVYQCNSRYTNATYNELSSFDISPSKFYRLCTLTLFVKDARFKLLCQL